MKILLLIIILTYCSSQNNNSVKNLSEIAKDGNWAGAPDSPNKKPYDYFYLLQKGNVKSRVKPELMEKACVDSVLRIGLNKITLEISKDVLEGVSFEGDGLTIRSYEMVSKELIKRNFKLEIKNCYSTSSEIDWKNCECLTYIYIPGGRDRIVEIATTFETAR